MADFIKRWSNWGWELLCAAFAEHTLPPNELARLEYLRCVHEEHQWQMQMAKQLGGPEMEGR